MTTLGGKPECVVCGHVIRAWPHRATLTDGRPVHVRCRDTGPDVARVLEQPEGDNAP